MENMEFLESVSDYALSRMQGVKSPDKNFRVMTKTSFRNKTSRRSNSVGGDRAHRVIVAESYSGRRRLLLTENTRAVGIKKVEKRGGRTRSGKYEKRGKRARVYKS